MTAKALKKKYPQEWADVEETVWNDLLLCIKDTPAEIRKRISYNAAFEACYILYRYKKPERRFL